MRQEDIIVPATFKVAVIGLGEAGSAIAHDLIRAGIRVHGWDPAPRGDVSQIRLAESGPTAAEQADVILSINTASVALAVARELLPVLRPGQIFADLNTSAPALKRELALLIEPTGAAFVDLALMAPVPGHGLYTPALASGTGASAFIELFKPLGMPVTLVDEQAGSAAQRKLLRSVFMKGLAAAAIESMAAASAAGCAEWMRNEITHQLIEADAALLDRLIEGSRKHAVRRTEEMIAATDLLHDLHVEPRIAQAAAGWLQELAKDSS
jgi:3-hydroxyisobutyrate dehydrogenase-like beta-hydroxyacid dehydrogenase